MIEVPERNAKPSAFPAWFVAFGALALFLALPQHSYWGDGRRLIMAVGLDEWRYHHVLYMPAAQIFRFLLQPILGSDPEPSMLVLAAVTTAAGAGFLTRAASLLGVGALGSITGGLLTALAPCVFFFGTSIEVHAPQVLAASLALFGFARWQRNSGTPNALSLTFLLLGLIGTHMSGALWAPAFLLHAFWGTGKFRLPTRLVPALILLVISFGVWKAVSTSDSHVPSLFFSSMKAIARAPNFDYIGSEFLATGACLFVLPLLFLGRRLFTQNAILVALLIVPPVVLYQTIHIEEQGAYFISLFPVLGLLSALALPRLGRFALPVAVVLLSVQGYLARSFVAEWQENYRGAEWSEPLIQQSRDRGLLLTLENWEAHAVQRHSHLEAVSLRIIIQKRIVELPIENPAQQASAIFMIEQARSRQQLLSITRSLVDYGLEKESVGQFIGVLFDRYGEPQPGAHEAYLVFPEPEAAPDRGS